MKKNIISFALVVVGSLTLFVHSVYAKKFTETSMYFNYYLKITENNSTFYNTKRLIKIEDEQSRGYFSINPRSLFYFEQEYEENKIDVDEKVMKEISKILYYGYNYNNQNANEYYFATQYLVDKAFRNYTVTFVNNYENPITIFTKEIAQIEKNIKENSFSYPDLTTENKQMEITDSYILKHFKIEGEHMKVIEDDKRILIELEDDLEDYILHFIPKLDCGALKMWQNNDSKYIYMDTICENAYTSNIHYEKKIEDSNSKEEHLEENGSNENFSQDLQIENNIKENDNQKEEDLVVEEMVPVPNTFKNSVSILLYLFLFGNTYYVFKK